MPLPILELKTLYCCASISCPSEMISLDPYLQFFGAVAQVLAAFLAVTAVFVMQKSEDYRVNMQRELRNIFYVLEDLRKKVNPSKLDAFDRFRNQVKGAEDHGPFNELEGIFVIGKVMEINILPYGPDVDQLSASTEALKNGRLNYFRRSRFMCNFRIIMSMGLVFVLFDLLCLMIAPGEKLPIDFFRFFAASTVLGHSVFLALIGFFINSGLRDTEK